MSTPEPIETDGCIAVWCADDEWCAITCTMDLIGNKWHPVIIDRLLTHERLHFNQLLGEIDAITNKVLAESLDDLEAKTLVAREVVTETPLRVEYTLTDRGRSLEPVIEALDAWGTEHLPHVQRAANEEEATCSSHRQRDDASRENGTICNGD